MLLYQHENEARDAGYLTVAGVDEAGRGPLAGPVVVAACILPSDEIIDGLNDSKQLTEKKRNELFQILTTHSKVRYSISILDHQEIDHLNILQATLKGMRLAIRRLKIKPDIVFIDGNKAPKLSIPYKTIVDGDKQSASIAAASIIAKVTRDGLMVKLHKRYPSWNFLKHKGYATKEHLELLCVHGASPVHRLTFAPVRQILERNGSGDNDFLESIQLDFIDDNKEFCLD